MESDCFLRPTWYYRSAPESCSCSGNTLRRNLAQFHNTASEVCKLITNSDLSARIMKIKVRIVTLDWNLPPIGCSTFHLNKEDRGRTWPSRWRTCYCRRPMYEGESGLSAGQMDVLRIKQRGTVENFSGIQSVSNRTMIVDSPSANAASAMNTSLLNENIVI